MGKIRHRRRPDVLYVHIGQMRQVEQVVVEQLVMARDMKRRIALHDRPVRMVHHVPVRQQAFIRLVRVARPDPDVLVLFEYRPGPHEAVRRHLRLAGDFHAGAGRVEFQPVIAALQDVADDLALRQRQVPVAAAVFQRDRVPGAVPEQDERLVQDGARQRFVRRHLVIPGSGVPGVFQKRFHRASG